MLSRNELKRHAAAFVRNEVAKLGGPEKATKDELEALAERIGAAVERRDGREGDPLKADYVSALGL